MYMHLKSFTFLYVDNIFVSVTKLQMAWKVEMFYKVPHKMYL